MKRALIKDLTDKREQPHGLFLVAYTDSDELEEYTTSEQFRVLSMDYYAEGGAVV